MTPDMSETTEIPLTALEQCRTGMSVRHVSMGRGTITNIANGVIYVRFDGPKARIGIYDANWFRIHPCALFGAQEHST